MMLRVRGPQGQATLKLEPEATVAAFRALLEEKTGVPAALQEVRLLGGCCRCTAALPQLPAGEPHS